jgi:hypothetical protein
MTYIRKREREKERERRENSEADVVDTGMLAAASAASGATSEMMRL